MITEVGISTLDTRDLKGHAPGKAGKDWQHFIRARHFRVAEYKNYVNAEFVSGCPDRFEFGESEFIGKDLIAQKVASCFKHPFSGPGSTESQEKRKVVLVGHDTSQDINYLRQIGFSISNYANVILDNVDTAQMFRVFTKDPNARSLGAMLYEFDLAGWHLHNAGNDAVYTLWAMLAMCVKATSERGSAEAENKQVDSLEKRTDVAVKQAVERVCLETDGFEDTGGDGGVPLPPTEAGGGLKGKPRFGPLRKEDQAEANRGLYTIGGPPLDV